MKKQKKDKKKKINRYLLIGTLGFFVLIFIFIYYNGKAREQKLKDKGFDSVAIVEKLKLNASKGTTGTEDIVYFYFVKGDTVFHKISSLHSGTIKRLKIKLNDAFLLRIVKDDYSIKKVNYKVRIDTFIDKRKYHIHRYNTLIHKNKIE
ncbi:hypothetical protein [Pseudotenacibaculum haliotis]|uniref:DUF4258 domain-containing protein n=1 Tax=Pseudotenacibaculum haliotis TaxID=1862138 RepID=A0ABW5LR18_9FLAO